MVEDRARCGLNIMVTADARPSSYTSKMVDGLKDCTFPNGPCFFANSESLPDGKFKIVDSQGKEYIFNAPDPEGIINGLLETDRGCLKAIRRELKKSTRKSVATK